MVLGIFRRRDPKKELRQALGDFDLPVFPAVLHSVLGMLRDPNASMPKIAEALSQDPGLSAQVLRQVNTAAFGLRRKVDNVSQAMSLLGTAGVESLVLAAAVRRSVPDTNGIAQSFWERSARRAAIARMVAKKLHPATAFQSFTGALLQDMAVPFLAHARREQYGPLLEHWGGSTDRTALHALEQSEFGWDHANIGGLMCNEWEFPDTLTGAIAGHHGHEELVKEVPPAVHLVSFIDGHREEDEVEQFIEVAHSTYGLGPDESREIVTSSTEAASELVAALRT